MVADLKQNEPDSTEHTAQHHSFVKTVFGEYSFLSQSRNQVSNSSEGKDVGKIGLDHSGAFREIWNKGPKDSKDESIGKVGNKKDVQLSLHMGFNKTKQSFYYTKNSPNLIIFRLYQFVKQSTRISVFKNQIVYHFTYYIDTFIKDIYFFRSFVCLFQEYLINTQVNYKIINEQLIFCLEQYLAEARKMHMALLEETIQRRQTELQIKDDVRCSKNIVKKILEHTQCSTEIKVKLMEGFKQALMQKLKKIEQGKLRSHKYPYSNLDKKDRVFASDQQHLIISLKNLRQIDQDQIQGLTSLHQLITRKNLSLKGKRRQLKESLKLTSCRTKLFQSVIIPNAKMTSSIIIGNGCEIMNPVKIAAKGQSKERDLQRARQLGSLSRLQQNKKCSQMYQSEMCSIMEPIIVEARRIYQNNRFLINTLKDGHKRQIQLNIWMKQVKVQILDNQIKLLNRQIKSEYLSNKDQQSRILSNLNLNMEESNQWQSQKEDFNNKLRSSTRQKEKQADQPQEEESKKQFLKYQSSSILQNQTPEQPQVSGSFVLGNSKTLTAISPNNHSQDENQEISFIQNLEQDKISSQFYQSNSIIPEQDEDDENNMRNQSFQTKPNTFVLPQECRKSSYQKNQIKQKCLVISESRSKNEQDLGNDGILELKINLRPDSDQQQQELTHEINKTDEFQKIAERQTKNHTNTSRFMDNYQKFQPLYKKDLQFNLNKSQGSSHSIKQCSASIRMPNYYQNTSNQDLSSSRNGMPNYYKNTGNQDLSNSSKNLAGSQNIFKNDSNNSRKTSNNIFRSSNKQNQPGNIPTQNSFSSNTSNWIQNSQHLKNPFGNSSKKSSSCSQNIFSADNHNAFASSSKKLNQNIQSFKQQQLYFGAALKSDQGVNGSMDIFTQKKSKNCSNQSTPILNNPFSNKFQQRQLKQVKNTFLLSDSKSLNPFALNAQSFQSKNEQSKQNIKKQDNPFASSNKPYCNPFAKDIPVQSFSANPFSSNRSGSNQAFSSYLDKNSNNPFRPFDSRNAQKECMSSNPFGGKHFQSSANFRSNGTYERNQQFLQKEKVLPKDQEQYFFY